MGRGSDVSRLPLLVVDGYNVIHGNTRYQALIDEHAGAGALADVAHLSRDPYGHDPYERAREALVADVAAYAQRAYEPVIVYDGAGNLNPDRPNRPVAGVDVVFSRTGESADTVIERLVTRARHENRDVLLVTSDNAIRFTVGGIPVTTVSSQLLAANLEIVDRDVHESRDERTHARLTLGDRLDPSTRAKLDALLGRR
ncbi:MAG: hypothetical protein E7Z98_08325 [Olsenella sp.]|nr:hypothetical protein [Olsenella sp.]